MKRLFLVLSSMLILGSPYALADDGIVISQSTPIISRSTQVQRLVSYIDVKQDYKGAPLTLVMNNGSGKTPGFKWFKVLVANRVIATEKNFATGVAKVDVSDMVMPGSTQLVLNGAGYPGAQFSWKLTTSVQPVKLSTVNPDEIVVGETATLSGENFSTTPTSNTVAFNKKNGTVKSATATELKVMVPKDALPGATMVNVTVSGVKSRDVKIKVRRVPELSSTSLQGVAPGEYISIMGKNFSKDASEVKVLFGETPGQIVEAGEDKVIVAAPTIPYEFGHHTPVPVSVQIGKIKSKNTLPVTVGPFMYKDPGLSGGEDTPVLPPGFSPNQY